MSLLQELNTQKSVEFMEDDKSALPDVTISELRKLINIGAKNSGEWKTALDLVQKSYSVKKINKPNSSTPAAWSQYQDMIAYAVNRMSFYHGLKGEWSSLKEFKVVFNIGDKILEETFDAEKIEDVVEVLQEHMDATAGKFKIENKKRSTVCHFLAHGIIKTQDKITITESNATLSK
jgi:hypothetical protein